MQLLLQIEVYMLMSHLLFLLKSTTQNDEKDKKEQRTRTKKSNTTRKKTKDQEEEKGNENGGCVFEYIEGAKKKKTGRTVRAVRAEGRARGCKWERGQGSRMEG